MVDMNRLSYKEKIQAQIRKARRENNRAKELYYTQCLNSSACVSFSFFSRSWAYTGWLKNNVKELWGESPIAPVQGNK